MYTARQSIHQTTLTMRIHDDEDYDDEYDDEDEDDEEFLDE